MGIAGGQLQVENGGEEKWCLGRLPGLCLKCQVGYGVTAWEKGARLEDQSLERKRKG